jgi:hypothetical protein
MTSQEKQYSQSGDLDRILEDVSVRFELRMKNLLDAQSAQFGGRLDIIEAELQKLKLLPDEILQIKSQNSSVEFQLERVQSHFQSVAARPLPHSPRRGPNQRDIVSHSVSGSRAELVN